MLIHSINMSFYLTVVNFIDKLLLIIAINTSIDRSVHNDKIVRPQKIDKAA